MAKNLAFSEYVLPLADAGATLETAGGKGKALTEMIRAGLPVPDGFHVTTAAYRAFVTENDLAPAICAALEAADPDKPASLETASRTIAALFAQGHIPSEVAGAIANAYRRLPNPDPLVAVRSSATAEDLPEASFAGQQETYLNIAGADAVLDAVRRCWASLWTARAIGYRARRAIGIEGLSLAVVVQRLVPAEAAGILFTANPVNGRRNEVVINAAWGLGEAVVGGEVTPDTYIINKKTEEILKREIAEKQVMTQRVDGGTATVPVSEDLRRAQVLDDRQIAELVQLGVKIAALYDGDPRDIEWALTPPSPSGRGTGGEGEFFILQARPITALPEPIAEPPQEWPMPDPDGKYMRGSIVDFMPDPLTPLFAAIGIPALCKGVTWMMETMMGGSLSLTEHYLVTINDYAYMSANLTAKDLWPVLKMLPAFPRLLANAAQHWEEVAHPRYEEAVAPWKEKQPETMAASELLEGVDALTQAMARYLTTLQVDSLGVAAGTEMLFTSVYDKLIKRDDDPAAPTYVMGFNSLPIQSEKAIYDLAQWCRKHENLAAHLQRRPARALAEHLDAENDDAPEGVSPDIWRAWRQRFQAYLDQYGHSIYDLDFAKPIPAHDPTPLLQTLQVFIRGQGRDPHARQQRLAAQREAASAAVRERVGGVRRKLFNTTLRWAQTFSHVREDSIFEIGLSYPTLRRMLLELGRRFTEADAIDQPDAIFWLERPEVEQGIAKLERGEPLDNHTARIEARQRRWRAEKHVTPPSQLPGKVRLMGINADAFMPVSAEEQTEETLKGVGCSPGQVTATARVLHGPEDFDQMQAGDILVADITTPAWTPLFAMAAGIVTNVGGPLSHGSIVAREYGIPAVLGTGVATRRIESGQTVTVDGEQGLVHLV